MIRLRSNGIYTFQITDPKLFVLKIVGTRGIFTNGQIEDFLRGIIIGRLSDILGETLDSVLDLPRYFDELGAGLKARIKDDFAQYGLAIVDFIINAITPPEEVQKRIDERSGMEAVGGMDRYFQFKAAQAIGDLATGAGGGGGGGGGGSGIGSAAAAGLGLGTGAGLGMMIPGMLQQAMAGGAQPKMRCPNCKQDVPVGSKFCPNCGHNLDATVEVPEVRHHRPGRLQVLPQLRQPRWARRRPGQEAQAAPPAATSPRKKTRSDERRSRLGGAARPLGGAAALGRRPAGRRWPRWPSLFLTPAPPGAGQGLEHRQHRRDPRRAEERRRHRRREGHLHLRGQLPLRQPRHPHRQPRTGSADIKVYDANGNAAARRGRAGHATASPTRAATSTSRSTSTSPTPRPPGPSTTGPADEIMFFDQGDELRWYVFDAETPVAIGAVKATVKLPGCGRPGQDDPGRPDRATGSSHTMTSPAASTMVYEATDIPAYTKFWIVTGFPKGVVKYTWTARRIGRVHRAQAGLRAADPLLPGHAAHLAQARP